MEHDDLLDLCRLNKLEDGIIHDNKRETVNSSEELQEIKRIIVIKRKQLAKRIVRNGPYFSKKQIKQIKTNEEEWNKYVEDNEFIKGDHGIENAKLTKE